MDVNRLHAAVLFLGTELNPWNFASAWKKDRYGKRFNRNLANVGRGREEIRDTRDSRFGAAPNFSPRHAVSTRLYIAVPTSPALSK